MTQLIPWTSTGKYSLNQIAKAHGMSVHQVITSSLASQSNPQLTTYVGQGNYNLPLPAGTGLLIPQTNWRT